MRMWLGGTRVHKRVHGKVRHGIITPFYRTHQRHNTLLTILICAHWSVKSSQQPLVSVTSPLMRSRHRGFPTEE